MSGRRNPNKVNIPDYEIISVAPFGEIVEVRREDSLSAYHFFRVVLFQDRLRAMKWQRGQIVSLEKNPDYGVPEEIKLMRQQIEFSQQGLQTSQPSEQTSGPDYEYVLRNHEMPEDAQKIKAIKEEGGSKDELQYTILRK